MIEEGTTSIMIIYFFHDLLANNVSKSRDQFCSRRRKGLLGIVAEERLKINGLGWLCVCVCVRVEVRIINAGKSWYSTDIKNSFTIPLLVYFIMAWSV